MPWSWGLQCCAYLAACTALLYSLCVASSSKLLAALVLKSLPSGAHHFGFQAAEEAQQRIEQAAAEAAKQAPEKGDIAAQVVRGTAQGVKEEAVPTAEVSHRLQCSASERALGMHFLMARAAQTCPQIAYRCFSGMGLPDAMGN